MGAGGHESGAEQEGEWASRGPRAHTPPTACQPPPPSVSAGVFNDNAFHVLPWEPVTVTFKAKSAVTAADLQATLTLTSLADTLSYSSTLYN